MRKSVRGRAGTSTRDPNANFIELRCYTVEVQSQLRAARVTRCRLFGDGSFYVRFHPVSLPAGDPSGGACFARCVLQARELVRSRTTGKTISACRYVAHSTRDGYKRSPCTQGN